MSKRTALTAQDVLARYRWPNMICTYAGLLEVLGKPHTLRIIHVLTTASPWRFTQIQKALQLQPKTLAARLQELVEFGLITRKSYNEIPPRVDYELTPTGREVTKIFAILSRWSERNRSVLMDGGVHPKIHQRP